MVYNLTYGGMAVSKIAQILKQNGAIICFTCGGMAVSNIAQILKQNGVIIYFTYAGMAVSNGNVKCVR